MNTNEQYLTLHTTSVCMEDLSSSFSASSGGKFLTPPHSPRKSFCDADHPIPSSDNRRASRSKPISVLGFHHQRSHSDTLCSVPDDVIESLLSGSSDYWSKLRERMEQDKEQEQHEVVSLVEEMREKYFSEQGLYAGQASAVFMKLSSPTKLLPGKRTPSGELQLLVLNSRDICTTGDLQELSPLVCNLTELDLANNAFTDWNQVYSMLGRMPHLVHCNLSQNPLNKDVPVNAPQVFMSKLNSLILNATGITWPALFHFMSLAPSLEELHISLNDYSNRSFLPPNSAPAFPGIHILHANNCRIDTWDKLKQVCRLFPCVETLVVAQNPIKRLDGEDQNGTVAEEMGDYLGCLHCLNCNKWELGCWNQIDMFRFLPLLSELRVGKLPLFEPYTDEERRYLLIARLPDVTMLNGSQVTPDQRLTAERFFLRHYAGSETKPRRYLELEPVHGTLEPLPTIDLSPKDVADVCITFDDKKERRKIDLNGNVGHLKKSLESFCGLPSRKFRIFYRDMGIASLRGDDEPDFELPLYCEELKFPKKLLWVLSIADGDEFHIQAKPEPPPRRRTSSSTGSQCGISKSKDE